MNSFEKTYFVNSKVSKESNKWTVTMVWFFQILIIILPVIAYYNIEYFLTMSAYNIFGPIFIYSFYLIFAFGHTNTYFYLWNLQDLDTLQDSVNKCYASPPNILMKMKTFYYEDICCQRKCDKQTETEEFKFSSWKDTSDEFDLLINTQNASRKPFAVIHLGIHVELNDEETSNDYDSQKIKFINQYKDRGEGFKYTEDVTLPNQNNYYMVRVNSNFAPFIHHAYFFLFLIIPFVEFYKLYVRFFCSEHLLIVKKIISSRYDVNSDAAEVVSIERLRRKKSLTTKFPAAVREFKLTPIKDPLIEK